MCGINGIIFKKNNIDTSKILYMNQMIKHRGPDQSGQLSFNNLLLGHTRLSILDLSTKGSQPMSVDGRYWIIYNGEVYNYKTIKEELIKKNYNFLSNTDTEVILNAYKEWGIDCFEKFNGEWSLAILDKKENNLLICRDGIGYKPCYIYEDEDYFAFSSEIKTFYCLNLSLNFNLSNLGIPNETLFNSSQTIFNNVNQLTQGRLLKINLNDNNKKLIRWDYPLKKLPKIHPGYNQNSEEYFNLLYKSTKLRLNSDVKIGTSLSGGLDSSAIFSLLNLIETNESFKKSNLDLNPLIINYSEMKSKEQAIELSKKYNKEYKVLEFKEEDISNTQALISSLETIEEYFMQYKLYNFQSNTGIRVSIDGHGADEFLGYPHWLTEMSVDIYNNLLNSYKTILKFGNTNNINKFKKLFGLSDKIPNEILFASTPQLTNIYSEYIDVRPFNNSYQIINDDIDELKNYSYALNFTYLISYCGWFQFFLNKWDRASMANSVEIRMPFLDNDVRLFSLALGTNNKIRNGFSKSILRNAFNKLIPESIINQNYKQGLKLKKFDKDSLKNDEFIKEILNQKEFKETDLWNAKKINKDFNQNINKTKIWNICKYYLMLNGFKLNFKSLKTNEKYRDVCNNLSEKK